MSKLWKFGLRWISLLGVAGILMISNGCGGGNGGDNGVDSAGNNAGNNGGGNGGDNVDRDTTPEAFSIAPQTGVALNAEVTSAPVTVTGINTPTPISVTNGTYSIGSGPFVTTPGTVTNNQTVRVRHTAPAYNMSSITSTLNIGGVTASFTSFTLPAPSQDVSPDTFTFTPLTGASLGRSLTSNAITVSGITSTALISITGGTYSISGGTFTSDTGTVLIGQNVMVRTNSSASNNSATTATLTIGDKSAPFTVTTMPSGGTTTTPAAFTFTNMTGVPTRTTVTSAPITVSGVTAATTPISVSGGTYSIGTAPFTSAAGTVTNNQSVRVQHTSSNRMGLDVLTTLNIGGVTGTFQSITKDLYDTTPDPFTFTTQTNVPLGATVTSNQITVSGLAMPVPIRVVAGSYSIDDGPFITTQQLITNGQRVTVRHSAATTSNTAAVTKLTIGLRSVYFYSSTGATVGTDTTPDPITFARQTNVPLHTEITSAPITITGIDAPVIIIVDGVVSSYSIDGGPFTSAAGTVFNGQTVRIRHTSNSGYGNANTTFVWIGELIASFTSTTQAAPQ